jgi:outer membrane protein
MQYDAQLLSVSVKSVLFPAILSMCLALASEAEAQQLTLQQAVDRAQKASDQSIAATASRDMARSRSRAFDMHRLPQLSLTGNAPIYAKDIQAVSQPDGTLDFRPVETTQADAGLTIGQQLPWTGGNLFVTSSLRRVDQTRGSTFDRTWTSAPVTFMIQQPILRPNLHRWNGRLDDVELDAAERTYLEAREGVALTATEAFFELYLAQRTLENARANAATNDTLFNLNKGRLEIGKIGENDLLQSELALLRARAALDNAKLEHARRLAAFRLVMRLPADSGMAISVPTAVPQFEADTLVAVQQALRNRARMSELESQELRARRRVAEARLGGGPGAEIRASLGFNQTGADMGLVYQDLQQSQRVSVGVSVPLFSFGARTADVQAARADQRQVQATTRQAREQLSQDAHFAALQLSQARRNLEVSAKADTVAAKRFEVAYNRYVIGRIGIDNLYIAQNEKDQAVNQYLQALRNFWAAYYRLRQSTLFDFETGQVIR